MNLLSIDASMRNIGACLFIDDEPVKLFYLDNNGVKCKSKYDTIYECFLYAIDFINSIPKGNLDAILLERPTGAQSFDSALNFSYEGCFRAYTQTLGIWQYTISPQKGKLIAGNKNAKKQDIIKWCVDRYPDLNYIKDKKGRVLNKNEHACDSLVNGLAFIKDFVD